MSNSSALHVDCPPKSIYRERNFLIGLFNDDNNLLNTSLNFSYIRLDEASSTENPLSYKVLATVMHVLIFIGGVFGNIVLIRVAHKTKGLQTPTYCYLVSLAYADLIVLFSAVPEAILFHHIHSRWVLGQAGCSLLIFGNFLGINAGSLSILAFTVERYIAVLHPFLAQRVCTVDRARKVVGCVWLLSIAYCTPWLGLTKVVPDTINPEIELCDFRLTKEQYFYFFMTDLVLFYVVPLLVAAVVYARIARQLKKQASRRDPRTLRGHRVIFESFSASTGSVNLNIPDSPALKSFPGRRSNAHINSNAQVLSMLMAVVILFAICWIPFRGLLVYNSIAQTPWLDLWFLLFAKTLIYFNCAVNPFLYNMMSLRFRKAVFLHLGIKSGQAESTVL